MDLSAILDQIVIKDSEEAKAVAVELGLGRVVPEPELGTFHFDYFKSANHPKGINSGMKYSGFCLINEKLEQVTTVASCRAYHIDATYAFHQGNDFSSVDYVHSYRQPDFSNIRIGWSHGTKVLEVVNFLNKLELDLGFEFSKVYKAENVNKSEMFMFVGDKRWQISGPMMSLYMVLIRNVGKTHTFDKTWQESLDAGCGDNPYSDVGFEYDLTESIRVIKEIASLGVSKFFKDDCEMNWYGQEPYSDTHDFGIQNFGYLYFLKGLEEEEEYGYHRVSYEQKRIMDYARKNKIKAEAVV
jgi:hypothetical protein